MNKRTVYLETTIVSYYVARPSRDLIIAARQQLTHEWWDEHRQKYRLVVSPVVAREIAAGDPAVAERRMELLAGVSVLSTETPINSLAREIESALRIPKPKVADALHLAYAIHHKVDIFLTWNCTHLANPDMERPLYDYCIANRLWFPLICTPEEMIARKEIPE